MPTWGAPLKKGLRLARAARSPRSLARLGLRTGLRAVGIAPIIGSILVFVIPLLQRLVTQAIQDYQRYWETVQRQKLQQQFQLQLHEAIWNNRLDEAVALRLKYQANLGEP